MTLRTQFTPFRLAVFATVFAFLVVVFGAFVRLSHAGLSCPDWPTCYGQATWPGHEQAIERANAAFPERPFETHKAWREQVHRMIAGTLGALVFALAVTAAWRRRAAVACLAIAALATMAGVWLYMRGAWLASGCLSAVAIGLPLVAAWRLDRPTPWRIAVATFAVIVFQAMLGMWTVTWLLKPVVVMGHLLGGFLTFVLLGTVALRLARPRIATPAQRRLKPLVIAALALLGVQVALGGWTSANYAALACGIDFPRCAGQWWSTMDFHQGFVLWRGIGVNYEGGVLDGAARAAIHVSHRIGAALVFAWVLSLAVLAFARGLRGYAALLAVLVCTQVALGIANVMAALPLAVATAHNGVAALLLLALVALLVRVTSAPDAASPLRART
jgi:cytochrome c oxidase assembly protein subunit 15